MTDEAKRAAFETIRRDGGIYTDADFDRDVSGNYVNAELHSFYEDWAEGFDAGALAKKGVCMFGEKCPAELQTEDLSRDLSAMKERAEKAEAERDSYNRAMKQADFELTHEIARAEKAEAALEALRERVRAHNASVDADPGMVAWRINLEGL